MTEIDNEKYVVFKREELFQVLGQFFGDTDGDPISTQLIEQVQATEITDAVVIRCQDRFAATAFDSYADSVLLGAEMLQEFSDEEDTETISYLREVSDFFRAKAEESRRDRRKIPN